MQDDGKKRRRSGKALSARSEKVSRGDGRNLDAASLVEVFSFLSTEDLAEAMLVSRHWEKTTREGSDRLWKQVTISKKWDMGDGWEEGKEFMYKVLAAAEEVEIVFFFRTHTGHIESVGRLFGANLRVLEIPHKSVSSAFFLTLFSQCPNLNTFLMDGEPTDRDPLVIRHPKLETLQLACQRARELTIDCPNLTHLSTAGTVSSIGLAEDPETQPFPSFN